MADAQANMNLNIDTSQALASIRALQAEIATFQQRMNRLNAGAAAQAASMQRNLINSINATGKFRAGITTVASSTDSFTNALEKNKLSIGQYFRYAGAASKTFGRMFKSEFGTIESVARERVKTLQTQYIKLGRDASGAMKAMAVRPLALDLQDLTTKTMIASQRMQLFNQLMKQGSTNLLNWGKNTQWAGRQLMVGFTIPLTIMGSMAAKSFMALEEQAIRFKRVYGELFTPSDEADKMLGQLQDLGLEFTKYGLALKDTMEMAADAAAMGKTGIDLLAQVEQASKLAALGGVEQKQALETTISLTNTFGIAAEDLTDKINFLNAVENQTVVSIEDLTEAIPKAGPVIQQLGGDVEDLAFFLTAMKEGGINASEGANALKSGLASLINPTEKAKEMLAGFGINLQGIVEANAGDIKGTVIQFAQALDTLDPLNRARAIEQLFGKFQFARLSTLFKNVISDGNQASRVLELTAASTEELAILSERELKRMESSPLYQFRQAWEQFQAALAPAGESFLKAVTPILEFGTKILDKFNEMGDGGKAFVVGLTAVLGVVAPVMLMVTGLIANGVANILMLIQNIRRLGSGKKEFQDLGIATDYMTQQQLEAEAVASALNQRHATLRQTFTSEAEAVRMLTAAYAESVAAQNTFMGRGGGKRVVSKKMAKGGFVSGYANGVVSVPGPKGKGDIVPAMLSPGEAVIPADMSQKYAPLINAMISDKIPGFRTGSGAEGRIGKSDATVMRMLGANVASQSGLASFGSIGGKADITSLYARDILKASGTTQAAINKQLEQWRTQNQKLIQKAVAAMKNGVSATEAFAPVVTKFNTDMKTAGGPIGQFTATANKMFPQLKADLQQAQAAAKRMNLNLMSGADTSRLAAALPNNIVAQKMVTPVNSGYQALTKLRSAASSMFGGGKTGLYGVPNFMLSGADAPAGSELAKARGSQEHVSRTKEQDAESAARRANTKAKQSEAAATEESAKQTKKETTTRTRATAAKEKEIAASQSNTAAAAGQRRGGIGAGGIGMIATTGVMAASMAPGKVGEIAQKAIMPVMMISMLGPMIGKMLTNPVGIIVAAIAAVAGSLIALNIHFKKVARETAALASSLSSGKQAMDTFTEFSGRATVSEIAAKRAQSAINPFQVQPGKSTFGQTFVEADQGKALVENLKKGITEFGQDATVQKLYVQLGQAVASGALSTAQAMSIASSVATELGDMDIAVDVNAQLMQLLNPDTNGDLLKDPLEIMANLTIARIENYEEIASQQARTTGEVFAEATASATEIWAAKGLGALFSGDWWKAGIDQFISPLISQDEKIRNYTNMVMAAKETLEGFATEIDQINVSSSDAINRAIEAGAGEAEINAIREQAVRNKETVLRDREAFLNQVEIDRAQDPAKFLLGMKGALSTLFQGDDLGKAERLMTKIGDLPSAKSFELQYLFSTGEVSLDRAQQILNDFDSRPDIAQKELDIAVGFDKNMADQIFAISKSIEDNPVLQQQYLALFDPNNVAKSTEALDAMLTVFNTSTNMIGDLGDIVIDFYVNDEDARNKLESNLKAIELLDSQQAAVDFVLNTYGEDQAAIATALFEKFPDGDVKTVTQAIVTLLDAQPTPRFNQIVKGYKGQNVAGVDVNDPNSAILAAISQMMTAGTLANQAVVEEPNVPTGGGGSSKITTPFDNILKKLRDYKDLQVGILEGWTKIGAKLEDLFGGDKALSGFRGLAQQMRSLGAGESLIELIVGMSPEDYEKYKDQLFVFDDKGTIAGLTNQAVNLGKALDAISLSEFENEQEKTLINMQKQVAAADKLVAAGLDWSQAYKIAADAGLAAAIVAERNLTDIREIVSLVKDVQKISEDTAAASAVVSANAATENLRKIQEFLLRNSTSLSDAQKKAILSDKDLQRLVLDPSINPNALRQALANASAQAKLDLQIKKLTFSGLQEIFSDGFSKAMEAFAVKEKAIELKFEVSRAPLIAAINSAQQAISDISNRPGGLDDLNAELTRMSYLEEDINDRYDSRINALQKVQELNQRIAQSQMSQLDIASALSRGDVAAAARAAAEQRKSQQQSAVQQQIQSLTSQKEAEISAIVSENGKTRLQIEKEIRTLQEEILNIEETRLEPAQYQLELIDRQIQAEKESLTVLGKTRQEWEAIKNQVDLAVIGSEEYVNAMKEALSVVGDIVNYWNNLDETTKDLFANVKMKVEKFEVPKALIEKVAKDILDGVGGVVEEEKKLPPPGANNNLYGPGSNLGGYLPPNWRPGDFSYPASTPQIRPPMPVTSGGEMLVNPFGGPSSLPVPANQLSYGEQMQKLFGWLFKDFGAAPGTAPKFGPDSGMGISPMPSADGGIPTPDTAGFAPTLEDLEKVKAKGQEVADAIAQFFNNIPTNISTTWTNIKTGFTTMTTNLSTTWNTFYTSHLKPKIDAVSTGWQTMKTNFSTAVGNMQTSWNTWYTDTIQPKLDAIKTGWQEMSSDFSTKVGEMKTTFNNWKTNDFDPTVKLMKDGLADLFKAETWKTWSTNAGDALKAAFKIALNGVISLINKIKLTIPKTIFGVTVPFIGGKTFGFNIPYLNSGGLVPGLGNTDTIPAMLTPGEFVIKKSTVEALGVNNLSKLNSGESLGNSMYNNYYSLNVNVKSDSNPQDIANTVMRAIKQVEGRRVRGNQF